MTRPSANLDKKMLEAGIKIIMKEGSAGLTVRKICSLAKVNLGMFNYCFKTKENYINRLYSGMQEETENFINIKSVEGKSGIEKLKYAILKLGERTRLNPKLAAALLLDGIKRQETYQKYLESGTLTQPDFFMYLILEAKEDGSLNTKVPAQEIFTLLIFGVLIAGLFEPHLSNMADMLSVPEKERFGGSFLEQRIDIILKGLEG